MVDQQNVRRRLAVTPLDLDIAHLNWEILNDGVMGGKSRSRVSTTAEKTILFDGNVSLENNGGFASARAQIGPLDLSRYDTLLMRVRGDGHRYRVRLWIKPGLDRVAYQSTFDTTPHTWLNAAVPFASFLPTFRGQTPARAGPFDASRIFQVGLMIADKQAGPFRVEIDWVEASRETDAAGHLPDRG